MGPKTRVLLLSNTCDFIDVRRPLWLEVGVSFAAVIVNSTYLQFYMSTFYIVRCQVSGPLWISSIYIFTCNSGIYVCTIYTRCCQSRLDTTDHALNYVARVTTSA
jgi:hypothetical protein